MMEIAIPSGAGMDFDFNSARTTPQPSAPSSPKRFGQYYYTSAPTSPSRISEFYQEFDNLYMMNDDEERTATPRSPKQDDFAFNFSVELEQASLTAEELFDGGKIRPSKPQPQSPRSTNPISQGKKIIRDVFSPRNKKKANPFAVAAAENKTEHERGRQRRNDLSSGSRRATRSLSPYRISEYPWEEEERQRQQHQQPSKQSSFNSKPPHPHPHTYPPPSSSSSSSKSSSRKWRFTDFLLFRSASEGRAADKDPLRKYSGFKRNEDKETRNTSSRSTDGSGSGKRKGPVSAHELHYTKNKAASQDLKKKTFLPYKSGILGFHGLGAFSRS